MFLILFPWLLRIASGRSPSEYDTSSTLLQTSPVRKVIRATKESNNDILTDQFTTSSTFTFIRKPTHTAVENMTEDEDSSDPILKQDLQFVKHKLFGVAIPAYVHKDLISEHLRRHAAWDLDEVQAICDAFRFNAGAKGNILDVGANIGTFSLPLAACIKKNAVGRAGTVTAVEGFPMNARHLRAGIVRNGFAENIRLYEYAVGGPGLATEAAMTEYHGNAGANALTGFGEAQNGAVTVKVPITTLDAIYEDDKEHFGNMFFMKIDIEGSEQAAFEGAAKFLKPGPCAIRMETYWNHKLVQLLKDKGYVEKSNRGDTQDTWMERHDFPECVNALT